jgi:small subunit ribosomal protein S17
MADEPENTEETTEDAHPRPNTADDAVTGETPADEIPVDEAPVDEAPAEEAPAAAAEETSAEEASAEEPAEDVPVEAEPAAEGDADPAADAEAAAPAEEGAPEPPQQRRERRRSTKTKTEKRAQREAAKKRALAARGPRERKAIVRLPKPEQERGRRTERRGIVVSSSMDKTIVVRVETSKPDRRYKKIIRRSSKFHAHDEANVANVGDLVRIVETRPLSKTKSWRLVEVLEAAK